MEDRLNALLAGADVTERASLLDGFVEQIAEAEIPDLLDWLFTRPNPELWDAVGDRLLRRWARCDGPAAVAWVEMLPDGLRRQALLNSAAIAWAGQNQPEALAWAGLRPEGPERDSVLIAVAGETMRTDPLEALRILLALPRDEQALAMIHHGLAEWALKDSAAASQWAMQIRGDEWRIPALVAITTVLADADPVAAATVALQEIPPGAEQDRAIVSVLQRWVQLDPQAAGQWLWRFPEGALRDAAFESFWSIWQSRDPATASAWLASVTNENAEGP